MREKHPFYYNKECELDFFTPDEALEPFIEDYIYFRFPSNQLMTDYLCPLSNGSYELYFCLGNSNVQIRSKRRNNSLKHFLLNISDIADKTLVKLVSKDDYYSCLVVQLKLSSIKQIINCNLRKKRERFIDIGELWNDTANEVKELLNNENDINVIISLLNDFFIKRINNSVKEQESIIYRVADYCIEKEGLITVEELANVFNISYRTLHRSFVKDLGVKPKEYLKILRFNKVCCLINKYPDIDWSELIYDCGYYDQSHFIHDFKAILKTSPDDFLKQTCGKLFLMRPYLLEK